MICWHEAAKECKSTIQRSSISILLFVCHAAEKAFRKLTMIDDGVLEIVVQNHVNGSFFELNQLHQESGITILKAYFCSGKPPNNDSPGGNAFLVPKRAPSAWSLYPGANPV
jgi:hypothetical protein